MNFRDIFIITRGTKVILAITFSVSVAAISFAFLYYRSVNRTEDPRIKNARDFLKTYEKFAGIPGHYYDFAYLDSAFTVFRSLPDYENSFETGLIYNNKCSALLLSAIYDSTLSRETKENLLSLSMKFCDSSILVYTRWNNEWGQLSEASIYEKIGEHMKIDDPDFAGYNFDKIISRRVRNIAIAQVETPRRLSVSYTNKGAIYRHMALPDSAVVYYGKALKLWPENITAKSNLSVLMGGQPVELSFIEKLFPSQRIKNKKVTIK